MKKIIFIILIVISFFIVINKDNVNASTKYYNAELFYSIKEDLSLIKDNIIIGFNANDNVYESLSDDLPIIVKDKDTGNSPLNIIDIN